MSDNQPEISFDPNLDLSTVEYFAGYDEPSATIVFVCSDKKAFRIHDYFLKAESPFFREMLEAGTKGGPIGLEETSKDLLFIFDRVTKRDFDSKFPTSANAKYRGTGQLVRAIELEVIARKYMLDTVNTCLRRYIMRFAEQDPPQALAFAANLQPPDGDITRAALKCFGNQMSGECLESSITRSPSASRCQADPYIPAPHKLKWSFVQNTLGLKAFYAYVLAMAAGESCSGKNHWLWDSVANHFIRELKMTEGKAVI